MILLSPAPENLRFCSPIITKPLKDVQLSQENLFGNCELFSSNFSKMASVKITVPVGGKESSAFKDALKVSIAASTYNSTVEWVKGNSLQREWFLMVAAGGRVTLDNKKAKLALNDANAIVRYYLDLNGLI